MATSSVELNQQRRRREHRQRQGQTESERGARGDGAAAQPAHKRAGERERAQGADRHEEQHDAELTVSDVKALLDHRDVWHPRGDDGAIDEEQGGDRAAGCRQPHVGPHAVWTPSVQRPVRSLERHTLDGRRR